MRQALTALAEKLRFSNGDLGDDSRLILSGVAYIDHLELELHKAKKAAEVLREVDGIPASLRRIAAALEKGAPSLFDQVFGKEKR